MRVRRSWIAWMVAAVATALAVQTAGASAVESTPLQVQSASLSQDGQQLVWQLQLTEPFSPAALAGEGRTLCLLIERAVDESVAGEACITGPDRRSGAPRLQYMPITRAGVGPAQAIAATVTRSSAREISYRFLPAEVHIGYQPLRWQVISTLRPPACVPPTPDRAGCVSLFPSEPALLRLHTPELVGCVPAGPDLVFSGPSNRHELALTFDDGPWPDPPAIDFVNTLARYHVPATFFEIGRQIGEYDPTGSAERAMLANGDMIGDHTWTHPDMVDLPPSQQRSELELTVDAIRRATGFTPCLWRPPYEDSDSQVDSLARSLGLLTINYDVDTQDWKLPGTATIYQRAVSGAHNGAIILQHFGGGPRYETLAALPEEIATLRHEGYRFVTVTQLLGLKLIYR